MIERVIILADSEVIHLRDLGIRPEPTSEITIKRGTLNDMERQIILTTLRQWEGNRTHAAKELGITRRTLLNKIKEYGTDER